MQRDEFRVFYPVSTRWMDNDVYGHVNNVTYYSYFDSTINRYLIEEGGLDIHKAPVVGFGFMMCMEKCCFMMGELCYHEKAVCYSSHRNASLS